MSPGKASPPALRGFAEAKSSTFQNPAADAGLAEAALPLASFDLVSAQDKVVHVVCACARPLAAGCRNCPARWERALHLLTHESVRRLSARSPQTTVINQRISAGQTQCRRFPSLGKLSVATGRP